MISTPTLLAGVLQILAMATLAGGIGAVAFMLVRVQRGAAGAAMAALAWFLVSAVVAGILWAAAWLLRWQYASGVVQRRILAALDRLAGPDEEPHASGAPGAGAAPRADQDQADQRELLRRVVDELLEINSALLMSPVERRAKGTRRRVKIAEKLTGDFNCAIVSHDFAVCEKLVGKFEEEIPSDERGAAMRRRLSAERMSAESDDAGSTSRRAADLMAISAFAQAEEVARALAARYPDSAQAKALLEKVSREARAFHAEQRGRLYGQLQRSADSRQWQAALDAARKLIEQYSDSPEGDAAAAMMETLADNARIEQVRTMRDSFSDMFKRKRYDEAMSIAQEIIDRFGDTNAAQDLRRQMPRLRELAGDEDKK